VTTSRYREAVELKIGDDRTFVIISLPDTSHAARARSEGRLTDTEISVDVGAWSGRYGAHFHETDFSTFARGLETLSGTLSGDAELSSLDGYLDLTLTGDGLGHISVRGTAWDTPRLGSHLEISFDIDPTYIPEMRKSVWAILTPPA